MSKLITPRVNLPKLKGIHLKVEFPDTGLLVTDRWEEAHSWVHNAYALQAAFLGRFRGEGATLATWDSDQYLFALSSSGGVFSSTSTASTVNELVNGSGDDEFGIVLGAGDEDFHILRYKVSDPIAHGSGAGQLVYSGMSAATQSKDGATGDYTIELTRIFNNNSGDAISVGCVGLVGQGHLFYGAETEILLAYDKLSSAVNVANGAQLTVTYTITVEQPTWLSGYTFPSVGDEQDGGWVAGYVTPGEYLVVAPKTGGESATLKYSDPADISISSDYEDGRLATAQLIASGNSPIGDFCATANGASLGGYTDWHIPSKDEIEVLRAAAASAPVGEGFETGNYWTSTYRSGGQAWVRSLNGSDYTWYKAQTDSYRIRLVRRLFVAEA